MNENQAHDTNDANAADPSSPESTDLLRRGVRRGATLWEKGGWLRFLVSAALFGILIWKMDEGTLLSRVRDMHVGHFAAAVALLAASNLVGCVQWRVLLHAQGLRPGIGLILSSYHVALFVSNFLPGHYGGDAVRVYDMYRDSGKGYRALAATFVDRLLGLVSLCLLALVVAPAFLGGQDRHALMALLFTSGVLVATVLLLFSRRTARVFRLLVRPFDSLGLADRIRSGYQAVHFYRGRPGVVAQAMVFSLAVQALRIVVHYETARSMGVESGIENFFLLIPLVAIFIALPISINGIGVREWVGVVLFRQVGVGREDAFGLLLLAYLAGVIVSLAGGFIFALRGRRQAGRLAAGAPIDQAPD